MNQPPLCVRPVHSRSEWRTLIEFPWALYKDDPNWVPPLLSQRRFAFDRVKNPTWEYTEGEFFIAWRGARAVGVIGAAINRRHNDFHGEKMGFFGHFDVYEDTEAATALLDTAADWVRARGMEALRGPLNMTVQDSIGCLVDGFDTPPMLLMPHNWPYYGELIEAAGLSKVMDLWAWAGSKEDVEASPNYEKMYRILEKQKKRRNITVRPGNMERLEEEIRQIQVLYQAGWKKNWGYVPLTEREIEHLVQDITQFYDPRLGFFAEREGEALGFMLPLPNFNQVLIHAYPRPGVPEWVTLLKAAWHWKVRPKIDSIRIILLGVREEYRGQGIDRMLIANAFSGAIEAGYTWGEASWILETNDQMNRGIKSNNWHVYKTYRIYQKPV